MKQGISGEVRVFFVVAVAFWISQKGSRMNGEYFVHMLESLAPRGI